MTTGSLQKIEDRVKAMIGKTYLNNALTHTVLSYKLDDEKLTIVTDRKWFSVDTQHGIRLMDNFLESDESPASLPATIPPPAAVAVSADLKGYLLDNIAKVQADKSYMPQAAEIANQIDTMINLAKVEIQYQLVLRK